VDLREVQDVSEHSLNFLHWNASWMVLLRRVYNGLSQMTQLNKKVVLAGQSFEMTAVTGNPKVFVLFL